MTTVEEATASSEGPQAPSGTAFQWAEALTGPAGAAWGPPLLLCLIYGLILAIQRRAPSGTVYEPLYMAWISGAKVPVMIDGGQPWRLVTAAFIHLTPVHLAINLIGTFFLGRLATRLFGGLRMWAIWGLCAIVGTVTSYATSPEWSLGASGGVFGLTGALAGALVRRHAIIPTEIRPVVRWRILPWLGLAALVTFRSDGVVDHAAHLGALAVGLMVGLMAPVRPLGARPGAPDALMGAVALLGLMVWGGLGVWQHHQKVSQPGGWRAVDNGQQPPMAFQVPGHWIEVPSPLVELCGRGFTDGLSQVCVGQWSDVAGAQGARDRLIGLGARVGLALIDPVIDGRPDGRWRPPLVFRRDPEVREATGDTMLAWIRPRSAGVDVVLLSAAVDPLSLPTLEGLEAGLLGGMPTPVQDQAPRR